MAHHATDHPLNVVFLRWASSAQGFKLTAHRDGRFSLRDDKHLYLKHASRALVARFLLE
jgi:hypothetical protein